MIQDDLRSLQSLVIKSLKDHHGTCSCRDVSGEYSEVVAVFVLGFLCGVFSELEQVVFFGTRTRQFNLTSECSKTLYRKSS